MTVVDVAKSELNYILFWRNILKPFFPKIVFQHSSTYLMLCEIVFNVLYLYFEVPSSILKIQHLHAV